MSEENIFDVPENKEEQNNEALDQHIEELKAKGIDELAKGKAHADQFIEFLKEQNAALKEDLDKRLNAEQSLEEFKRQQEETARRNQEESTDSRLGEEDVKNLVESTLVQKTKEQQAEVNRSVVDRKIKETYGEKAQEFVASKAESLGLTLEYMRSLAETSPNAFFSLVGMGEQTTPGTSMSSPGINTEALNRQPSGDVAGTWRYYQKMRKDDPSKYYDPKIQMQMFNDRKEKGEDFYK